MTNNSNCFDACARAAKKVKGRTIWIVVSWLWVRMGDYTNFQRNVGCLTLRPEIVYNVRSHLLHMLYYKLSGLPLVPFSRSLPVLELQLGSVIHLRSLPTALVHLIMVCSFLSEALLASITVASTVQAQSYLPYSDGQCKNLITNFTVRQAGSDVPTNVTSSFYLPGLPNALWWDSPKFNGAEAKEGSGYDVWWKVGPTDNMCGVALMQQY